MPGFVVAIAHKGKILIYTRYVLVTLVTKVRPCNPVLVTLVTQDCTGSKVTEPCNECCAKYQRGSVY